MGVERASEDVVVRIGSLIELDCTEHQMLRTEMYHHGLRDVRLDVWHSAKVHENLHDGRVRLDGTILNERGEADRRSNALNIEAVLARESANPRLNRTSEYLKTNWQTMQRANQLARLPKILVELFGLLERAVEKGFCEASCLGASIRTANF